MASKYSTRLKKDDFLHKYKAKLEHPKVDDDLSEGVVVACFCEGELSDLGTVVHVESDTKLPKDHSELHRRRFHFGVR